MVKDLGQCDYLMNDWRHCDVTGDVDSHNIGVIWEKERLNNNNT